MDHAINLFIFAILALAGLVMDFIGFVDGICAGFMNQAHIPPNAQTILLAVVAVALVLLAIRVLGRVFAALIIILLVLILVHHAAPNLAVPQAHLPPGFKLPSLGHTTI